MTDWPTLRRHLLAGERLSEDEALYLGDQDDTAALSAVAGMLRDRGHGTIVTYSRKLFIPLTHL